MPNWCMNNVSVTHKNPEMIKRMKAAISEDKMCEEFVPNPNKEWDYFWCVENWGTKWEPTGIDILDEDSTCLVLMFDSAWSAPVPFFEHLTKLGFDIDATYHEPGMAFAGHYSSTDGNKIYEYNFSDENWRDSIDDEDVLDILEAEYEIWSEWDEEELEEENSKENEQ